MAEDVSYASVSYLTSDALNILYRLNKKRLLPSPGPSKLPRDWRGIANLAGITAQDAESSHQNTLKWILETWVRNNEDSATVHQLFRHLETIDRYDIRDDLQDLASSSKLINRERKWTTENQVVARRAPEGGEELLTMDDVDEGAPVEYDALVLFDESDQDFIDDMIRNMTTIGFRLFTKHSLRPGIMPYRPMTELINSRCRHTIVVYSSAFFENVDDKFYTDYVHARHIETGHRLIPCVNKECELPPQYRYYFPLYVHSVAYNFWDRLAKAVDVGRYPRLTSPNSAYSVRIQEVTSNQLRITNGPVSNGQVSNCQVSNRQVSNGQVSNGQVPNGHINHNSQPSNAYVTQPSTETIALPDVPTTTLSLSVSTLNSMDSRHIDTTSLNDLSANKKKKKSFSFLRKPFRWATRNKNKKPLLATN